MRKRPSRLSGAVVVSVSVMASLAACSGKQLPYAGGLMIAVQTDLVAPKDVGAVGLYISSDGRPVFGDTRDTAPNGEVKFPATIAVLADEKRPKATIKIRVVAFARDGKVRILRDAITTVPRGRTGLLRAPLLWINEGSGDGKRSDLVQTASLRPLDAVSDAYAKIKSACPDEQTVIDGECADAHIDGESLPDYNEKDVFGGGNAEGSGGSCFDVKQCFASAQPVFLGAGCTVTLLEGQSPTDPNLSLAVALKELPGGPEMNTGECLGNGVCLVPLDKGTSWSVEGKGIRLPAGICKRINVGAALGVVASLACVSKTQIVPACGEACSVRNDKPITPEGGPREAGAIVFDASTDGSIELDAGKDSGQDAGLRDSGGPADAGNPNPKDSGADAPVNDASGAGDASGPPDAAPPLPFGPPVTYQIGEPGPANLTFDGANLYFGRQRNGGFEPNILSFALSNVLANPSGTSLVRQTMFPNTTPGNAAPIFGLGTDMSGPFAVAAFEAGPPWSFSRVRFGSAPSPFNTVTMAPNNVVRTIAVTPARAYVGTNDASPTLSVYDFMTTQWSTFTIPTAVGAVTALRFIGGELFVGLSNGDIFRCSDVGAPCSAASIIFFTGQPGGAVRAFADDAGLPPTVYWANDANGIFKLDGVGTTQIGMAGIAMTNSTSLAVDGTYAYFPRGQEVMAVPISGLNLPGLRLAIEPDPVTSLVVTPEHVFYATVLGPGTNFIRAACKRFANPTCN